MWHDWPGWRAVLNGKKGVLSALEIGLDLDMGIFFDDWQACLRSHYIYVIRAGDSVTEPTLRHVLLHSGIDETELEALRAQAEALGPLDPDEPEPDAALPVDLATDDLGGEVGEIAAADVAVDEAGTVLDGDGDPDGDLFEDDSEDDLYEDGEGDDEPPAVAPNQLSLF